MLYNTTHRFTKIIAPPSQEEIYNCPHYFAMSYDQVKASGAPQFLINLLDQFPFDGRKNILQIRPQDFRNHIPGIDGRHWHADYNVRLLKEDGKTEWKAYAKNHDEFHLMVISWGAGCNTEFIDTPMELPDNLIDNGKYHDQWKSELDHKITKEPITIVEAKKNQMAEYSGRDLHRAGSTIHSQGLRLMIVAFDCDDINGNIRILPTVRELSGNAPFKE